MDLLLCLVMALGLTLYVMTWFIPSPRFPTQALQVIGDVIIRANASTPLLFFVAALFYLSRWGRTMGRDKVWLVVGVAITLPLWFLAGLPVGIKGVGDITLLLVPWNLLALGVMFVGVHRSLSGAPKKEAGSQG